MPRLLPDGIGKFLRKGSDLVLQIHYHPDGKPETDQSVVGIYFTQDAGPEDRRRDRRPDPQPRHSAPARRRYHVDRAERRRCRWTSRRSASRPHMHYIGKEMKVVAQTPDGKTIPLIWIKDWDFNWQGQYQYQTPVKLPKGSVIKLDAYYDNSAENPSNPSKPPKRVPLGRADDRRDVPAGRPGRHRQPGRPAQDRRDARQPPGSGLVGGDGAATGRAGRLAPGCGDGLTAAGPDPRAVQGRLGRFDTNNDGKLSAKEIDAMPEGLAAIGSAQAIRRRDGADPAGP